MSSNDQVIALLQDALALLQTGKKARKPRAGAKRGGNKGLIKLDLQRKLVLKEMIAEWEKLPKSAREQKHTVTKTKKVKGEEVEVEVEELKHPQPNYKDAISECKRRKDAGEELPEVPEEDIEAAWAAQQEKNSVSESAAEESSAEAETEAEPEPEPKKKAGRPKKEEAAVVEEAKAAAKKPVKKAKA